LRLFTLIALAYLATSTWAEEISHKGTTYTIDVETQDLDCGSFIVLLTERALPFSVRESEIPHEITLGHFGKPHVLSQEFSYVSKFTARTLTDLKEIIPEYERIETKRKYLAKATKCVSPNFVLFSFWGGGNCKTVCEAWALVEFSEDGRAISSQGLSYQQYQQLN